MLINLRANRAAFSNWITFFFFGAIIISAFFSEIFQAPEHKDTEINSLRLVFNQGDLDGVNQVILRNSLGKFHFEQAKANNSQWNIISPRNLPANRNIILNMIETLKKLQIRKIYEKDKIYLSNFSLNNPLFSIDLIFNDGKETTVDFGLINPLDNSTYISLSKQDAIYHIDGFSSNFTSLDLTSFVDNRVFNFDTKDVASLKFFQGKSSTKPTLAFERKQDKWLSATGKTLDDQKIDEFLASLQNIRSNIILDEISEALNEKINQHLEKPYYRLFFNLKNGEEVKVEMSGAIPNLPDLKLEKWQNIIVKSSNVISPIILNKGNLKNIYIRESKLKKIPFKKLFY
ncbi:MAG: DUF4340 domain-containing protein [Oligoflexia bacterium]|nr:DUF4340 domain-containing protein [Oligoflexia bacterium]